MLLKAPDTPHDGVPALLFIYEKNDLLFDFFVKDNKVE